MNTIDTMSVNAIRVLSADAIQKGSSFLSFKNRRFACV